MGGGSRSFNVGASFGVGVHEPPPGRPSLTATALPPVADSTDDGDVLVCVIETDTDGTYHERMEHERKSRLSRWQKQDTQRG